MVHNPFLAFVIFGTLNLLITQINSSFIQTFVLFAPGLSTMVIFSYTVFCQFLCSNVVLNSYFFSDGLTHIKFNKL